MEVPLPAGRGRSAMELQVLPLTSARWDDLEAVFGARGCAMARGCWCMYYRIRGQQPGDGAAGRRETARNALRALADADPPAGLIGYLDGTPVGWVSLGPREDYARLARSPVMKPVDDSAVWSIVCFVVPSAYRGRGVATGLLDGAIAHARGHGVCLLEAYPLDTDVADAADANWFGARRMFARAGFEELARRRPDRPLMRLALQDADAVTASSTARPRPRSR